MITLTILNGIMFIFLIILRFYKKKHIHNYVFLKEIKCYGTNIKYPEYLLRVHECSICKEVKKVKIE